MIKHLNEPPPPLRVARPDLPSQLEDVLSKALAKDPNARYQTAGELLVGFKAALGGTAISSLISDPNTPTHIAQFYSDPTLRAEQPPAIPAQLYQELAELKEAVRKLSQAPALQTAEPSAGPSAKRKQEAPAPTAAQPPAESESVPKKPRVSGEAILSLILALLALGVTASFIIGAIIIINQATVLTQTICGPDTCTYYYSPNYGTFWGLMTAGLFAFVAGIPAILLGRRARRQIRQSNGRLIGLRAAESGLVLAWIVPGDWAAMLLWQLLKLLWKLLKLLGTLFHLIARLFFRD